jgi:hypothetical protein
MERKPVIVIDLPKKKTSTNTHDTFGAGFFFSRTFVEPSSGIPRGRIGDFGL